MITTQLDDWQKHISFNWHNEKCFEALLVHWTTFHWCCYAVFARAAPEREQEAAAPVLLPLPCSCPPEKNLDGDKVPSGTHAKVWLIKRHFLQDITDVCDICDFVAFPNINKKFQLMLTRRVKAYSSSSSVV